MRIGEEYAVHLFQAKDTQFIFCRATSAWRVGGGRACVKVICRVYASWSAITDRKVKLLTFRDSAVHDFSRRLKDELSLLCMYHRKYDVFLNK